MKKNQEEPNEEKDTIEELLHLGDSPPPFPCVVLLFPEYSYSTGYLKFLIHLNMKGIFLFQMPEYLPFVVISSGDPKTVVYHPSLFGGYQGGIQSIIIIKINNKTINYSLLDICKSTIKQ